MVNDAETRRGRFRKFQQPDELPVQVPLCPLPSSQLAAAPAATPAFVPLMVPVAEVLAPYCTDTLPALMLPLVT
jgi:hypothetical protein